MGLTEWLKMLEKKAITKQKKTGTCRLRSFHKTARHLSIQEREVGVSWTLPEVISEYKSSVKPPKLNEALG
ncbi:hypothetical protein A7Q10_01820 [Methylacidiphilum caldifontis]|uniref:Uncharacterized protein n=1 Tax=Methylacidiphilum caldifontis TaxID=2795386 RepID=A0A4Y8P8G1_9BACT|nr:hypothetical protein A7Q10_01820 [Methylacidiphilum caldifontis]